MQAEPMTNLTIINLGLHIVWASPMLIKFRDPEQNILSRPPTEDEEAWIVSINQLIGGFVLLFTGSLMSYLGRRKLFIIMYIPRLAMCILLLFATDVWMILLGKALGGMSDLITISAVSTYAAEVAGKDIRGASGTLTQILSATGMMVMFAVGPFVSYLAVNLVMTCIVVLTFIPMLFIPESPYFLYSKGRTQEAIEVLTLLRGTEELAHEEIKEFASSQEGDDTSTKVDIKSLMKDRAVLKAFALIIFLSLGLQLIGYNAVNFYLQTIFESTGTSISSEVSSLIIGLVQLLASFCTFFMTDRFGRKPILCTSLIGMFIGMIGLGTFFVLFENGREIVGFLNFLPLISIIIIIYGFNAGMGSLHWIVVAELFEGPARPYAVSSAMLIGIFSGFLLTFFFPALLNSIGPAILYYFFAGGCLLVCLVIYVFVPETKGKSFAEIQTALGRRDVNIVDVKGAVLSCKVQNHARHDATEYVLVLLSSRHRARQRAFPQSTSRGTRHETNESCFCQFYHIDIVVYIL